eukprot:1079083-Amphidinium_carterae.2
MATLSESHSSLVSHCKYVAEDEMQITLRYAMKLQQSHYRMNSIPIIAMHTRLSFFRTYCAGFFILVCWARRPLICWSSTHHSPESLLGRADGSARRSCP